MVTLGWMRRERRTRAATVVMAAAACYLVGPFALAAQSAGPPGRDWPRSDLRSSGLAEGPWAALDSAIVAGRHGHVDRVLVLRGGRIVYDRAYARDYRTIAAGARAFIGCGPGACDGADIPATYNYFDPATHPFRAGTDLHSLQSVTKSVIATVLAAAQQAGVVRATADTPFLSLLGDAARWAGDPRLQRATLADLLTMRSGIEWHEIDRPLDGTNTTVALERSDDWVRFTLSQPMDAAPGERFVYNSGGSHLIGAIIAAQTGRDPVQVADELLFRPLGIRAFHWKRAGEGLPDGEGGLYLGAEDVARIGYLMLHDGMWGTRRILPAGWARTATSRVVERTPNGLGYGYQWWRLDRDGVEIFGGLGFGGQFLFVIPQYDVIVVSFAWNVFGQRVPSLQGPLIAAVLSSVPRE